MIRELVEYLVKTIVSMPDKVQVLSRQNDDKDFLEISVAQEDRGRLIGKNGKTIRAIRQCVETIFPDKNNLVIDLLHINK